MLMYGLSYFFFFSSRRRHTRYIGDWSSDVCSSDLYDRYGLYRVIDLGKWWHKVTGLPLPLGGNAVRRSLGPELISSVSNALRESIQYALDHRSEALAYALQFARDLDPQLADKFVAMYVNERTLDYGSDGREAVQRLLDMGYQAGIIPHPARVDFV